MSTIADAMDGATAELRACRVAMDALRGSVSDQLAGKVTQAQTVINNFLNRAPVVEVFIDANNGVDDTTRAGAGTISFPYKSLDYVLDTRDQSVVLVVRMLTDDTLKSRHTGFSAIHLSGVAAIAANGLPWSYARRRLSCLPEATNSPQPGLGRCIPGITMYGGLIEVFSVDIALPTPPSGVSSMDFFSFNGGSYAGTFSVVSVDTAGSGVALIATSGLTQLVASFQNYGLGTNAAGHMFRGVAAGGDPNATFAFRSNITSA